MNIKEKEFLDGIKSSLQDSNAEALKCLVSDFATFTFKDTDPSLEEYSNEFLSSLIDIMGSTTFLGLEGSYNLLMLFEYDWGILTPNQKEIFFDYIEKHFTRFSDWMAPFVLSEILGEYFCDNNSYTLLTNIVNSNYEEDLKAFACHGIAHFVEFTKNDIVKDAIQIFLGKLVVEPSEVVREEALLALNKLHKSRNA